MIGAVSGLLAAMLIGLFDADQAAWPERWSEERRAEVRQLLERSTIEPIPTSEEMRAAMKRNGRRVRLFEGRWRHVPELEERRAEGCVLLEFTVRPDGKTDQYRILKSYPAGVFEELAIVSAYAMRFEPAGAPVEHRELFAFPTPARSDVRERCVTLERSPST